MSSSSLARRERHSLCDLAAELGPGAPTLCEGWRSADLVAHLFVREHRPHAALGMFVPPLSGLTDAAMRRAQRPGYPALVDKVRDPGLLTPFAVPAVEKLANSIEYVVHHEDLRRGSSDWEPRPATSWAAADLDLLWKQLGVMGKGLVKAAGVPVRLVREDTGATQDLVGSGDGVVLTGPVVELVLLLSGRDAVRGVQTTGPDAAVEAFGGSARGM